jgi:hypothetical protein
MGGDVHTGFTTELSCSKTNSTIRAVTATPITNHVCGFYESMEGDFNDRYHFKHTHYPDQRNFCVLEAEFDDVLVEVPLFHHTSRLFGVLEVG